MSFCHGKLRLLTFLLGAVCVALALVAAAPASATALKPTILVDGDTILLGDLFENAGEAAHAVVARSPAPGETMQLAAWSVQRLAAQYGIRWDNALRLETVPVKRASHVLTAAEITERIKDLIAKETGAAQLEVSLNQARLVIHMPTERANAPHISLTALDRQSGRFEAQIDADLDQRFRVSGTAVEVMDVPVLTRTIERGETISDADLAWLGIRIDRIGANILTNPDELVGLAAKRPLRSGTPLSQTDLERPLAVKKGALVTMTYSVPGMTLTDTGRAIDQGSMGDVIAVLNPKSHRTVYGTIVGPDAIVVDGGGSGSRRQEAALYR